VSEPSAAQAAPVATEVAPPEVEPPGTRTVPGSLAAAARLPGVPWCGLMPTPENANSDMFVRPISAAPARRSRATAVQSAAAGATSASAFAAAVLRWPCTSNRSFTLTASPANGGSGPPAARSASTPRAAARATGSSSEMKV